MTKTGVERLVRFPNYGTILYYSTHRPDIWRDECTSPIVDKDKAEKRVEVWGGGWEINCYGQAQAKTARYLHHGFFDLLHFI